MSATSTSNRALVLGRGKSGEAAAKVLREKGLEVDFAEGYDIVIASPGLQVKSELELGCLELKKRGWKLLAITGSKGKSSVVKLVAEALGGIPCGNYGTPVTELVGLPPGWAVVEVSSFQLETTTLPPDTFESAAILNLQEDHLDRHGSKEVYHNLKRKLLSFAKVGVTTAEETDRALLAGSYFDNEILWTNGAMGVKLMRAAGLDDAAIRGAFENFVPLKHRMNLVAEIDGVKYIDDSKATSLAALEAGVMMAGEKVRLIAGGLPKGDDPKSVLSTLTKRVEKVYLIGVAANSFFDAWSNSVSCEIVETMDKAVEKAKAEAVKGESVLLSPGTASFDQFKSYGERGDVFAALVKKEGKDK